MPSWLRIDLGDGMLAWQPLDSIRERFEAAYREAGEPGDMALFKRHDSEGRLHCRVMLYFPPGAASLARTLGAEPCPRPAADGLEWLAGTHPWQHLFTDRD